MVKAKQSDAGCWQMPGTTHVEGTEIRRLKGWRAGVMGVRGSLLFVARMKPFLTHLLSLWLRVLMPVAWAQGHR